MLDSCIIIDSYKDLNERRKAARRAILKALKPYSFKETINSNTHIPKEIYDAINKKGFLLQKLYEFFIRTTPDEYFDSICSGLNLVFSLVPLPHEASKKRMRHEINMHPVF